MSQLSKNDLRTKSREELYGLLMLAFRSASSTKAGSPTRAKALGAVTAIQAELLTRDPPQ